MSDGSKSGVNWTRLNLHPSALANVFASNVLANQGKSSSNMFPLERIPTLTRSKFSSFPMMTFATSPISACEIWLTVEIKSFVRPVPACAIPADMVSPWALTQRRTVRIRTSRLGAGGSLKNVTSGDKGVREVTSFMNAPLWNSYFQNREAISMMLDMRSLPNGC